MFKPGDTISHSSHGIGVIQSFHEKELLCSRSIFATLYFDEQGLQVTVAENRLEQQVRHLMNRTDAGNMVSYLTDLQ